jgi:hypothetical protein
MTRPGSQVSFGSTPGPRSAPTSTGTAFIAGVCASGRSDAAVLCHTIEDVIASFGPRDTGGLLYDAADNAFASGVIDLWVGRRVGADATVATVTLKDSATPGVDSVAVDAIGAGVSTLEVQPVAGPISDSIVLVITDSVSGKLVEQSTPAISVSDLVSWGANKARAVRVRMLGATLPKALGAAVALAGGDDDRGSIVDDTLQAELTQFFPRRLGPGQVMVPGVTTVEGHVAMANFAQNENKFAVWDGPDSANESTCIAALQALQVSSDLQSLAETFGFFWAPWRVVPGVTSSTVRVLPPSPTVCGLIAHSDAATGNPNVPAAGANGIDEYGVSSSQPEWSDDQRQDLNDAGVNVFHQVGDGSQRAYGWRTAAITDGTNDASAAWLSAGAARLRMDLTNRFELLAESFLFQEIDGLGHLIAAFNGAISGILKGYWTAGALYGATADEAFSVDTGSTVNTPDTINNQELHAKIGLKISPFAEMIYFDVFKAAITAAAA